MSRSRVAFPIVVIVLTLLACVSSQAQPNCTTMVPITPFQDIKGVPRPATITDVELRLDGKPAQVASLERDLTPLRAILVLDGSGSMSPVTKNTYGFWQMELYLAGKILAYAPPGSKFGLLAFHGREYRAFNPADPGTLYPKLAELKDFPFASKAPPGKTPLWDAVADAASMLEPASIHDAVIVLSDGGDNESKLSVEDLARKLSSKGVRVFTLAFSDNSPRTEEERVGPTEMRDQVAFRP